MDIELPQENTLEPRIKKMKNPKTSEKVDKPKIVEIKEKHANKGDILEYVSYTKKKKRGLFQGPILTPNNKYGDSSTPTR